MTKKKDAQLNVNNLAVMRAQEPQEFEFLRFDSINDCNVHCIYCHVHRSKAVVDTAEFLAFLEHNVISLENFQIGCIMEPTLDPRMCDLMLLLARSRVRPTQKFILHTNGTLLHRHDHAKMRDAGLTRLSVSIDAADPTIHKLLRGGTSLAKVMSNIAAFIKSCPAAEVVFVTTVARMNIDAMESLVAFGLELGVRTFQLREVFYLPENDVVDHSRMPDLLLGENDFSRMRERLMARFGERAYLEFSDNATLEQSTVRIKADSFR